MNSNHKKLVYKINKYYPDQYIVNEAALESLSPTVLKNLLKSDRYSGYFVSSIIKYNVVSKVVYDIDTSKTKVQRFRDRKKDRYSITQIYIKKELKQKFKESCLRDNISMQDKINQLIKDYLY